MSAAPIKLDYVLTSEDLDAAFERSRTELRPSWIRRIGACLAAWLMIDGWSRHDWWFTAMLLLVAIELWTSPLCFYWIAWLVMKVVPRAGETRNVQIETDDRGLTVRYPPQKSVNRFWWSRLTRADQTDFGIELYFDGRHWYELEIPWKAFSSDASREEFINIVSQQL